MIEPGGWGKEEKEWDLPDFGNEDEWIEKPALTDANIEVETLPPVIVYTTTTATRVEPIFPVSVILMQLL